MAWVFWRTGLTDGLIDDLHAPAIFDPNAIAATFPAGLVEPLRGFLEVELPARVGRLEAFGTIDEVTRRLTCGAVELLGDDAAIDGDVVGLAYEHIG